MEVPSETGTDYYRLDGNHLSHSRQQVEYSGIRYRAKYDCLRQQPSTVDSPSSGGRFQRE
ncbi:hypothetical protein M3J09_013714 [Ascochyta lentis]